MTKNKLKLLQILSRQLGTKFFYITSISVLFSFSSCDESSVVGLDVQPPNDLLNVEYVDTVTLVTQTVKEDSLKTDESLLDAVASTSGAALIGKYIDPNFGIATSSLYTSLKLSTTITTSSFGNNPIIDSVVLAMVYDTSYFGKRERKMQTLQVFQLTEQVSQTYIYFSNNTLSKSSLALATQNFTPKPFDSVLVDGKKEKPQLRVRLDNNFGQTILNNQASGNLANNDALQSFIKGFFITTENTSLATPLDGNIVRFNMGDAQTKFTLYYHFTGKKISNPALDSIIYTKYDFLLGGVHRFLEYKHNYAGPNVDAALSSQLTATTFNQNNTVYIQSLAGVKVKMQMPYIKHMNDSGAVAVNKAELILKVDPSPSYYIDTFAVPKALTLFGINDDGTSYVLPDALEGDTYFNGKYNSTTKQYVFNIARYVQQILAGKKNNNGLYILSSGGYILPGRVVIGGGGTGTYQMKLNITYTKLH